MRYSKYIIAVAITFCTVQFSSAQNNYTTHILMQGESLSLLAKQYNTSVGDIMRLNGMHADTKLVYGSKIKVPSNKKQVSVKAESNVIITEKPVITAPANGTKHTVVKGETLYSISKKYNVSMDELKTWNNLTDNNAKLGMVLIVGNISNENVAVIPVKKQRVETVAAPVEKKEIVIDEAINKQPVEAGTHINVESVPASQTNNNSFSLVADKPLKNYSGEGFFATQFKERKRKEMQDISGISKIFKTASGWTDGKFYILANDIEPGTIVKVTAGNGNAVYAKVLWSMGDLKENAGVDFRVSNATAAALREDDQSFNVSISF